MCGRYWERGRLELSPIPGTRHTLAFSPLKPLLVRGWGGVAAVDGVFLHSEMERGVRNVTQSNATRSVTRFSHQHEPAWAWHNTTNRSAKAIIDGGGRCHETDCKTLASKKCKLEDNLTDGSLLYPPYMASSSRGSVGVEQRRVALLSVDGLWKQTHKQRYSRVSKNRSGASSAESKSLNKHTSRNTRTKNIQ